MEEKFQNILDNYINGNRGDAKKAFDELSGNELHNFKGWLWNKFPENNTLIFEFVVFLL